MRVGSQASATCAGVASEMAGNITGLHDAAALIEARQKELVDRLMRLAPAEGLNPCAIAPVTLMRRNQPMLHVPTLHAASVCFVVQGRKRPVLGDETCHHDPLSYLVVSVSLPMVGEVLEATPEQPYLCLRLALDVEQITQLRLQLPKSSARPATPRGLFVAPMHEPMPDAVLRLLRLLDQPEEAAVLAPLALREIYYRVLVGELGHRLADIGENGAGLHRIARVVEHIRQHYAEPLRIEELAALANLSVSSLHHRFKAVTAMSPLQYQKQLRLHEARRLMIGEGSDAASAGHRVGYESPSQFSREYRRLFGARPRAEIARLREVAA